MKKILGSALVVVLIGSAWWTTKELGWQSDIKSFLQPENLKTWIGQFGLLAPIIFMAFYYIVTLCFISAALFTVLAGVLFGKLWGSVYVIIAATAAAQTAFYISRYLGSDKIDQLKNKKGIGKFITLLKEKSEKNGFRNFFILRCLFLPYMPISYATGMIKEAKARDFFFATLLANMIFSPAFVFFGDSLLQGPKALILPVILIGLVLLVPKLVKKFHPKS